MDMHIELMCYIVLPYHRLAAFPSVKELFQLITFLLHLPSLFLNGHQIHQTKTTQIFRKQMMEKPLWFPMISLFIIININ